MIARLFALKQGGCMRKKLIALGSKTSLKPRAGIEDIYELTYVRKNGSRFLAMV
jgi:hypothetical protein